LLHAKRAACGTVRIRAHPHTRDLAAWRHPHIFDTGNVAGERGTRLVMWITAAMTAIEVAAGWFYNSMALPAGSLHMSSHAVAIGLSAPLREGSPLCLRHLEYRGAGRFRQRCPLLVVVALMVHGWVTRLLQPEPIHYPQAMLVAAIGLGVNLFSARILGAAQPDHHHHHGHGHAQDLNPKSTYVHVVADAATSMAAIVALAGG